MATPIFYDASFVIALHNKEDPRHRDTIRVSEEVLADFHPFSRVLTDYVFDEIVTRVKDHGRQTLRAIEVAKWLRTAEWTLELIASEEFEEAYALFIRRDDKGWSFTDCTSCVWMDRHRVRYAVSWDTHFDQFGHAENLARR